MDISGYAYAPRVSVDFEVAEKAIIAWSKVCERMAVFQHDGDKSVSRTHIHVLMLGVKVKEEQLKRMFKKAVPGLPAKGNEFWSWEHKKFGTPDDKFLTYMSKGVLRPVFIKNFPADLVEERRQQWVMPTPKSVESSDKKTDMYDEMLKVFFAQLSNVELQEYSRDFNGLRKWVFAWFYHKTGKIPHATQYKQYAGSLFLKLGEKYKRFSENSDQVFSLWY